MGSTVRLLGTCALALSLIVSGCAKKESEAEKQLAETKKQLEEANKKLEGAGMQPVAPPSPAAEKGASPLETSKPGWGDNKPVVSEPVTHTLAAGTSIAVRTTATISTKTSVTGAAFVATLNQPLEVDGYMLAPRGATVDGVVVNSDPGGKVKGVASITVGLRRIVLADGRSLAINTDSRGAQANTTKKKDAMKVGIGAGIGAAIGAIAGGGKGAAIGAGVGGAGGTGLMLATKGDPAVIPAESLLTFKLTAPVSVQELKK